MVADNSGGGLPPSSAGPTTSPGPSPLVPDHELVCSIGRGSYGVVWLARSVLGALRAVKVVYRNRFRDARPYEREFSGILRVEPLSRIHEGLVDILHVGRHEPQGYFYYVMELADDANERLFPATGRALDATRYQSRTLASELKQRGRLPFEECVQLGLTLGSALSLIHHHGLIHRDVKPANILYLGGAPKLGDIGLVGEAGESASYVGTDGYIPPEGPGTAQADVFSLGKVLYEASTGLDRLEFPLLPGEAGNEASAAHLAELNAVVLKACAPDPRNRYATAEEFHADLALLHRGQSVRQHRKAERRSRVAVVASYVLLLAAGMAIGAWWSPRGRPVEINTETNAAAVAPAGRPHAVDLSPYYNAELGSNWLHDFPENHLGTLPRNWQQIGGTFFQTGGLLQLSGGYTDSRDLHYPAAVKDIPVHQTCVRLHFLHGVVWQPAQSPHVATYLLHYADGQEVEIPLLYGKDFLNWWWNRYEPREAERATVAWIGTNAATVRDKTMPLLRLFHLTWHNPRPEVPIQSLDFLSMNTAAAPFLIGVTAE